MENRVSQGLFEAYMQTNARIMKRKAAALQPVKPYSDNLVGGNAETQAIA